jgi:two-component system, OmpR family, sensor histidine kinase KdpD
MNHENAVASRRVIQGLWPGSAFVVLVTLGSYRLHFSYATAGFLFLLVLVVQSITASFWSSAILSVVAVGCLDYFFVPPIRSLRILDSRDVLALATCLLTSLVITRQASKARNQTLVARQHRKELELLFRAARQLLTLEPDAAPAKCPEIFHGIFDFQAVCVFEASTAGVWLAGVSMAGLPERTRDAYLQDHDTDGAGSRIRLSCLRVAGKPIGAIGFEGGSSSRAVAGALSVLAASTLERARTYELSMKTVADTRAETLRSAVLDAFAHEFKTPLTAILVAAGGVHEVGHINSRQHELVATIESEVTRLGQLTTRLLRMARLDHEDVKPYLKRTDLSELVARIVDRQAATVTDAKLSIELASEPVFVMVDPDLLSLALIHLLDNARQNSRPGSVTVVQVSGENHYGAVRVSNPGSSIPPGAEPPLSDFQDAGKDSRPAAGAGLGLYVARKILVAHYGRLELEFERTETGAATFCMRLPSSQREVDRVL